ncbi:hypothetical protein ABPG74_014326 [Tetrahymena malaccensis]
MQNLEDRRMVLKYVYYTWVVIQAILVITSTSLIINQIVNKNDIEAIDSSLSIQWDIIKEQINTLEKNLKESSNKYNQFICNIQLPDQSSSELKFKDIVLTIDSLTNQVKKLKDDVKDINTEQINQGDQVKQLTQQNSSFDKIIKEMQRNFNETIASLTNQANKLKDDVIDIKTEQINQGDQVKQLTQQNSSFDKIIKEMQRNFNETIASLTNQAKKLKDDVIDIKTEQINQGDQVKQLTQQNSSFDKIIKEMQRNFNETIASLTNQANKLKDDVKDIKTEQINQGDQVKQLTQQNSSYDKNIKEIQSNFNETIANHTSLNLKFKDLSSTLNNTQQNITLLAEQIPKIKIFGPSFTKDWWWQFQTANVNEIYSHPTCIIKANFSKNQRVTATINHHMSSTQRCSVFVLRDRKVVMPNDLNNFIPTNQYFYEPPGWKSVNFVTHFTNEPGTFIFEIGVKCEGSASVSTNGPALTIMSEDLIP